MSSATELTEAAAAAVVDPWQDVAPPVPPTIAAAALQLLLVSIICITNARTRHAEVYRAA